MENILIKIGVFLLGGIIGYIVYLKTGEKALNVIFELVASIGSGLVMPIVYVIRRHQKSRTLNI